MFDATRAVRLVPLLLCLTLATPLQAQDCDRSCLEALMSQVLDAQLAHDASGLPLAPDFRYTENGQDIALDDGLWMTYTRHSDYRLYVADPVAGQLAWLSVIEEGDTPVIAYYRMRVQNRLISELELLLARGSQQATLENLVEPKPIFMEVLPPEQRVSRAELVRIADSYFEGLDTLESGAGVPFHPDCMRQENGTWLANNPNAPEGSMQRLGCKEQFDTGFSTIVTDVRERRYLVLDEERGLVYAHVFFDHDGTPTTMGGVGGVTRPVQAPFNRPMTFMIGELFKIVDGQIRQIEAVIVTVPFGMPSGWDGADSAIAVATPVGRAAAPAAPPTAPAAGSTPITSCDRQCLLGMVDQYLRALVARDASQAPFAPDARFTENTVSLPLHSGLWGTASALPGTYDLRAADPQTGNAAFYVIIEENGSPAWLSGRLHVTNGLIDELETVVIRQGAGLAGFDLPAVDPEWTAIVPPEQRNTREELAAIADGYVETLEQNLAGHVQFSDDCNRIENGVFTANSPTATTGLGAASCQENVDSGMWVYITEINPRRILVVDEEQGLAMGMFMFHHNGQHDHAMVNGERVEYSGATRRPFTTVIPEMFKVRDGRITRIIAMMTSIPYRSQSGWD